MPDQSGLANPSPPVAQAVGHRCAIHGRPTRRAECRVCNAAYQRAYLQRRRVEAPAKEMWRRARGRARKLGIAFEIADDLIIPERCPVLGLRLTSGGKRSASSPSLDRINPALGYVTDNIRIISDRANRLKGNRTLQQLKSLANFGPPAHREDYQKVARYLDRELLLMEVRQKAASSGRAACEWKKVADFLHAAFQCQPL